MGLCASADNGPPACDMPDPEASLSAGERRPSGAYPEMSVPFDETGSFKGLNSSFSHAWDSVEPPVLLLLQTVSGVAILSGQSSCELNVKRNLTVDGLKRMLHREDIMSTFWEVTSVAPERTGSAMPGFRTFSSMRDGDVLLLSCNHRSRVLSGHTGGVERVIPLRAGFIASASWDYSIRLWDLQTGECLQILEGHQRGVTCIAQLPSGQLVSASVDSRIIIWSQEGGDEGKYEVGQTINGHTKDVTCLAVTPGGEWIVSGSADTTVVAWSISANGTFNVVSGSLDQTIIHSSLDGTSIVKLKGHRAGVTCLHHLDSGELASGSEDKTVRLWDLSTQACLHVFSQHKRAVLSINQLLDGRIVTGCDSTDTCTLRILGPDACNEVGNSDLKGDGDAINSVVLLPAGELLLGSKSGMIHVVDVTAAEPSLPSEHAECLAEAWVLRCGEKIAPAEMLVPEEMKHQWAAGVSFGLELSPVMCDGGSEYGARVVSTLESEPRKLVGMVVCAVHGPGVLGCEHEAPWNDEDASLSTIDYKVVLRKLAMAGRPMTVQFRNDLSTNELRNARSKLLRTEPDDKHRTEVLLPGEEESPNSTFYPSRKKVVLRGSLY